MNKDPEAGMHAVTKVVGNVYFCDFESGERKFARFFGRGSAPLSERSAASPEVGEEDDAGGRRQNAVADPEVA